VSYLSSCLTFHSVFFSPLYPSPYIHFSTFPLSPSHLVSSSRPSHHISSESPLFWTSPCVHLTSYISCLHLCTPLPTASPLHPGAPSGQISPGYPSPCDRVGFGAFTLLYRIEVTHNQHDHLSPPLIHPNFQTTLYIISPLILSLHFSLSNCLNFCLQSKVIIALTL
jgi:hypothetical protein